MTMDLGHVGIWSRELRYNPDRGARAAAAAELDDLGYVFGGSQETLPLDAWRRLAPILTGH